MSYIILKIIGTFLFLQIDYKGNSEMDAGIERAFGHQLPLVGPLVDKYLHKLDQMMYKKASSRSFNWLYTNIQRIYS